MAPFQTSGRSAQAINLGDDRFFGVDRRDPRTLPVGALHDGENLRFYDLIPQTRRGVMKPTWGQLLDAGVPGFISAWGETHGVGVFKDPARTEWMLLAADGHIWRSRPNNYPVTIALPTGVAIRSAVTFCQAFDKVFCFRGQYLAPLLMANFDDGFEDLVPQWDAADTYAANDEVAYGPFIDVDSITRVNNTATVVTDDPHGYVDGADITIAGAVETAYNGRVNITVVDEFTFTFQVSGAPTTPATGTITCSNMSQYWKAEEAPNTPSTGDSPDSAPTKWARIYNILPNADNALYVNNRLLVPTAYEPSGTGDYSTITGLTLRKKDYIVATDYLDDVHFDFSNEFRINQGSADEIVDLAKFNEDTVVVWKNNSWGVLTNVGLDLSDLKLDMRSQSYGICARGAWALSGLDLDFMADKRGVVSIRQTEQNKLVCVDIPLSAPIQKIIDRINWNAAEGIRMENWDSKLYTAVPLDNSATNNAILVFDFVLAVKADNPELGWLGPDTGDAIVPKEFVKVREQKLERLLFLGTDNMVSMMEASDSGDQVADADTDTGLTMTEITTRFKTRGYLPAATGYSRPTQAILVLKTWNPQYTVTAEFAGVNRSTTLCTDKTRSRTRYFRPFDRAAWDETNVNDDHGTKDREDYSVVIPDEGLDLGSGVALDLFQEAIHTLGLAGRQSRSFQIDLTNTQGRIQLLAVQMDAVPDRQRPGILI